MKRKMLCTILSMLLLITSFTPIMKAASYSDQKSELQDKVNEAEEQKDKVESQKKDTLSQIEDLEDSIAQYESKLEDIKADITKLENQISAKTKEINALQKEYEEKQELLKDRLVAIYEEGQITFLDMMLSSDNMWDYFAIEARMQEMAEADNAQMDELETKRQQVEKAKNELQESKSSLDSSKKTLENTQAQLKVTKASKEAKVSSLSSQEKKLQKQIEDYMKDIKEIDAKIRAQANKAQDVYTGSFSGTLGWPVSSSSSGYNVITSRFGSRNSPVAGASSNHRGVDIGVSIGTPVYSSADGYVISVMQTSARGIFVLIKHANDLYTRYQHLSRAVVSSGQYVKRGQLIAYSGNTGVGSGPHLHFEVLKTPYYLSEINPLTCGLVSLPNLIYY